MPRNRFVWIIPPLILLAAILACKQPSNPLTNPTMAFSIPVTASTPLSGAEPTSAAYLPYIRRVGDSTIDTPTPEPSRELPSLRTEEEQYTVQGGDTLGIIAARFDISVQLLVEANNITNPDLLAVGQVLVIPAPIPGEPGSAFKIIPDSELVYGPQSQSFDVADFVSRFDSYLGRYSEDVEGQTLSGVEIVQLLAHDYSVNPRLLLAVLEYQSGWVTLANPAPETRDYPIGVQDTYRKGLYRQLAWAANNLNLGYYLWRVNAVGGWVLTSGNVVPIDPTINAGTAGVQQLFALLYDRSSWDYAISPNGLFATYSNFFGYPFDYAVEPLIPPDLAQPAMQLPFEPGVDWAFTGGPHGGWGEGSAWAALDFAPGGNALGCVQSDLWVVAVADGLILRADQGRVIQDLDGDGNEGTGWVVLYMHIESRDRVLAGTYLRAGERIGHPSCEGGFSSGTHVHLARRYNGEWIPADQSQAGIAIPFTLDGWISSGNGIEYDGYLERDGETLEAWEGYFPENTIHR